MRKTKIICTLGPASDSDAVLERLIQEGMDVARFNFSHGTHEEQKKRLTKLRLLRERYGRPVATLLDTKGPEIRVRDFKDGAITLQKGDEFVLTGREVEGDEHIVTITYPELVGDVKVGQRILIDDGLIEMTVKELTDTDIICDVNNGGKVSNHKGINVPGIHLSLPYISEVDKSDLLFGIEEDVDYVAASFVRTAEDVQQIRKLLQENGGEQIKIIAKIENREGVNCIDEIIEVSDAIMIARGDMGVEIPTEEVPVIQKMIIKKVYEAGKQVITATQMLDSMIHNPRPTRAEATDVANAIYDGTSAIMLSGETAAGDYPVEAVETMVRIALRTEADINYISRLRARKTNEKPSITDAISHTACLMAGDLNATSIVTVTKSGRTARMISKYRPQSPIIGGCMSDKVCRQLNLSWGVIPLKVEEKQDADELFDHALERSKEAGLIQEGDTVVLTAGVPLGIAGTTNLLKAHIV